MTWSYRVHCEVHTEHADKTRKHLNFNRCDDAATSSARGFVQSTKANPRTHFCLLFHFRRAAPVR